MRKFLSLFLAGCLIFLLPATIWASAETTYESEQGQAMIKAPSSSVFGSGDSTDIDDGGAVEQLAVVRGVHHIEQSASCAAGQILEPGLQTGSQIGFYLFLVVLPLHDLLAHYCQRRKEWIVLLLRHQGAAAEQAGIRQVVDGVDRFIDQHREDILRGQTGVDE